MHKRTANGRPKFSSTICPQMDSKLTSKIFINRLCTNVRLTICAQIVHRNIRRPILRTANEQQTDVRNICQPFDICNFLLYIKRKWQPILVATGINGLNSEQEQKCNSICICIVYFRVRMVVLNPPSFLLWTSVCQGNSSYRYVITLSALI